MTAQVFQGTFPSHDHLKLFYRFFPAPRAGQDTFVILHGHGEHTGRYEKFASMLENENLAIATFDSRGHGRSEGPEVYVEHFEDYVEDVSSFVRFLEEKFHVGKILLFGHSIGGLVAIQWALRFPKKIRALILSSPCLGLRMPKWLMAFNAFLNAWCPRLVYQNPVYPPHLTHNPKEVEAYRNDRLVKRKMSVRLLHEMLSSIDRLEVSTAIRFSFPVTILMADDLEKVVDPAKTKLFFQKVQAPAKEIKTFPGFYHEIFNELGQEKAFDALRDCIAQSRSAGP